MAKRSKVQIRETYSKMLGEDLVAKLSDDQIVILSKYYNSLDAKETSDLDSQLIQGRNDTDLHEMARDMIGEEEEEDIPEGLDDLLGSIIEPKVTTIQSSAIVPAKFFGERYEKYRDELISEGTIEGEQLTGEERKEGFKTRNDPNKFGTFIENFLNRKKESDEAVSAAGGGGSFIITRERIDSNKIVPLEEKEDPMSGVVNALDELLDEVRKGFKLEEKKAEKDRKKEEKKKRKKEEAKLEEKTKESFLDKSAKKVLKPVKNIFDKIFGFLSKILLGKVLINLIDWISDPENKSKIDNIFKFLKDWWPALLGAYVLFGTSFGRFIRTIVGITTKFTAKLLKTAIPALLRAAAANPVTAALVAGGALAAGGAFLASQQNEKRRAELDAVDDDAVVTPKETREEGQMPGASQLMQEQILQRGMGMAFEGGGEVKGVPGIDKNPAMLTDGEFVMSKGAVQKYGVDTLEGMNAAGGGTNIPKMANNIVYASGGGLIGEEPRKDTTHEKPLPEPLSLAMNTGGEVQPIEKMEFNPKNYFTGDNVYNSKRIVNPGQTGKSFFVRYAQTPDGIEVRQVNKVVKDGNLFNGFTPDLTEVKPGSDEYQKVIGSANTKGVVESELKDRAKFNTRSSSVSKEMKPERDKVNKWIEGGRNLIVSPHAMVGYDYNQSYQVNKANLIESELLGTDKKTIELGAASAASMFAMPGSDASVLPTHEESPVSAETTNQYTVATEPQGQDKNKPKTPTEMIMAYINARLPGGAGSKPETKEDKDHGQVVTPTNKEYEDKTGKPSNVPGISVVGKGSRKPSQGSKISGELGRYLDKSGLGIWGSGVHQHPEHPDWPKESGHSAGSLHYESQGARAIDIGGWGPNLFKQKGNSGVDDQTKILNGIKDFNRKNQVKPVQLLHEGNDPAGHSDHVHVAYNSGGEVKGKTGVDKNPAMLSKGEVVMNNEAVQGVGKQNLLAANKHYGGQDANKPKIVKGTMHAASGGAVEPARVGKKNVKSAPITPLNRSKPKVTFVDLGTDKELVGTSSGRGSTVPAFSASSSSRTKINTLGINL